MVTNYGFGITNSLNCPFFMHAHVRMSRYLTWPVLVPMGLGVPGNRAPVMAGLKIEYFIPPVLKEPEYFIIVIVLRVIEEGLIVLITALRGHSALKVRGEEGPIALKVIVMARKALSLLGEGPIALTIRIMIRTVLRVLDAAVRSIKGRALAFLRVKVSEGHLTPLVTNPPMDGYLPSISVSILIHRTTHINSSLQDTQEWTMGYRVDTIHHRMDTIHHRLDIIHHRVDTVIQLTLMTS